MTKRTLIFTTFSILVFLSIIYFLPVAYGYDYIFNDAENDVYRYCESTSDVVIGDYHDEIDIVKLNVTGKYVSVTIVGDIVDWNNSHFIYVTFSYYFAPSGAIGYSWGPPYYKIDFKSSSFITLEKDYYSGGYGSIKEVWNGTAWENQTTATPANILNDVSQHTISAYIPDPVEEIPSDMKCLLNTVYIKPFTDCDYMDYAPVRPALENGIILGYNILILISSVIGISMLVLRKQNKLK